MPIGVATAATVAGVAATSTAAMAAVSTGVALVGTAAAAGTAIGATAVEVGAMGATLGAVEGGVAAGATAGIEGAAVAGAEGAALGVGEGAAAGLGEGMAGGLGTVEGGLGAGAMDLGAAGATEGVASGATSGGTGLFGSGISGTQAMQGANLIKTGAGMIDGGGGGADPASGGGGALDQVAANNNVADPHSITPAGSTAPGSYNTPVSITGSAPGDSGVVQGAQYTPGADKALADPKSGGVLDWMSRNKLLVGGIGAAGMLGASMLGKKKAATPTAAQFQTKPAGFTSGLPQVNQTKAAVSPTNPSWYTYGRPSNPNPGESTFYTGNQLPRARGGDVHGDSDDRPSGGALSHFIQGPGGGQDDLINVDVPDGSYVMDATTVADLGDGNSDEGARKLEEFRQGIHTTHKAKGGALSQVDQKPRANIPAKLSSKEFVFDPHSVDLLGGGDNKRGAALLDEMRDAIAKQKGRKHRVPAPAKDISSYLKAS